MRGGGEGRWRSSLESHTTSTSFSSLGFILVMATKMNLNGVRLTWLQRHSRVNKAGAAAVLSGVRLASQPRLQPLLPASTPTMSSVEEVAAQGWS